MSVEKMLEVKSTDVPYIYDDNFQIALLMRLDSYKFSHPEAYPGDVIGMSSYGEARVENSQVIVPFGLQTFIKRYLTVPITMADVDKAEAFALAHFGRKLFRRATWERIVNEFGGYLPITIRAVPEGTKIRGGQPIYSVTAIGKDFFWLSSAIETPLQRAIWYPTTIVTNDYNIKQELKRLYAKTGAKSPVEFALHDFGARGVPSGETAENGGGAHTVCFMGSDTVEGVLSVNHFYKEIMAAFSVYATEHSVQTAFGPTKENQLQYLKHQIKNAPRGAIISLVIDGFHVYREAQQLCSSPLKEMIIESGVKVVFRPDSGDMMEVVPRLLKMQAEAFGYEVNEKGYKVIKHVGLIQGDGVDSKKIVELLELLTGPEYMFAADCMIFGSGGALLQKVNRDTFKFAQKASAIKVQYSTTEPDVIGRKLESKWIGISKNPITDQGKKSKEGVMTLLRSKMTGELMTGRLDDGGFCDEWEDAHVLAYQNGKLYNETILAEVRARVNA